MTPPRQHPHRSGLPLPPQSASGTRDPQLWWLLGGCAVLLLFVLGLTVDFVLARTPRPTAIPYGTTTPRRAEHATLKAGASAGSTRNYIDDVFLVRLTTMTSDAAIAGTANGITIEVNETLQTFGTIGRMGPMYTVLGSDGNTYAATCVDAQRYRFEQTGGRSTYTTAGTTRSLTFTLPEGVTATALQVRYHLPDGTDAEISFDAP